jgi:hypothetical protein
MVNNLGYADVWDGIDAIKLVEEVFEVKIADVESETIANVGDLYDLLLKKIPADEANRKCGSAMAFYRLRRALAEEYPSKKITPSYDLSCLDISARKFLRTLAKKSGLALPNRSPTWMRQIAKVFAIICFYGPFAFDAYAIFYAHAFKLSAGFFVAAGLLTWLFGLVVISALYNLDPGRLPKGCETLGGLARRTAHLNFLRLRKLGAQQNDADLWNALVEVLSSFNDFPADRIGRDTFFYKGAMKDYLKRAA